MTRNANHRPRLTDAEVERARRLSLVHPQCVVAEIIGATPSTIRAAANRGWKPAQRLLRPVPNDWGLVAPGRGLVELAAHYRTSQTIVLRWLRERPVERPHNGGNTWAPPEGFAALFEHHSARQVAKLLGVNEATIKRARERLGIHPRQIAARRSVGWVEQYCATRNATGMIG